jgi:hypothetical protein
MHWLLSTSEMPYAIPNKNPAFMTALEDGVYRR